MQLLQAGRSLKNINVSMETSFIRNCKKFIFATFYIFHVAIFI